ncbi:MAG TPA: inorganic phosphate transporter, partial [Marinagarivorans sp.]
ALAAGAVWLNFATWMGAPVSTTHSIVGGILGAGVAAGGFAIANWSKMGAIAASWVISPVMGGVIAATLLMFIKRTILYQDDVKTAAQRFVPWLVALMAWAFTSYLLTKGLKKIWNPSAPEAFGWALVVAALAYFLTRKRLLAMGDRIENSIAGVNKLFTIPLIFAAGLLSFAHGANDVANAIGPLAAITEALSSGAIAGKAPIPIWVMVIGALGLAVGLALFGPKLIRTVGGEITELDKSRAYCIAMAAAITVIIASQLGLPVSSTHIALGGVFGVGFLREYLKTRYASKLHQAIDDHTGEARVQIEQFLKEFQSAGVEEMRAMLKKSSVQATLPITEKERKRLKKVYRQELVKRRHLYKIAAAWVITVPASALLGAMMFFMLRGMLLPAG